MRIGTDEVKDNEHFGRSVEKDTICYRRSGLTIHRFLQANQAGFDNAKMQYGPIKGCQVIYSKIAIYRFVFRANCT